jgi:ribosomal protection tetracycline resistance protein
MQALAEAGTAVCEPIVRVSVEAPADAVGPVLAAAARLGGVLEPLSLLGGLSRVEAVLPAARAHDLQRQLPGLTGGEGMLESSFCGYQPVSGAAPTRRRTTANPLSRPEYLMQLARRATGGSDD